MRLVPLTTLLTLTATAAVAAPFRTEPPPAMALLAAAKTPKQAPPVIDPASPAAPDLFELEVDPYAGTFVGKEVALGAAAVFATDLVCGIFGGGIAFAALQIGGTNNFTAQVVAIAAGALFALVDVVVAPLMAALGAYSLSKKEHNNGLFGAGLGAYVAQAITIATAAVVYLGAALLVGGLFATGVEGAPGARIGVTVFSVIALAVLATLHYVGLPLGASFGIHWTGALNEKRPTGPRTEKRAQTTPRLTVPLIAVRF